MSGTRDAPTATGVDVQQQRRLLVRQPVLLSPLLGVAMGGDVAALEALLADGAQRAAVNSVRDSTGRSALHFAANGACVRALCACGADVFAADALGSTPLHAATERQCAGAVRELLAAAEGSAADACNARCVNAQNALGETALHIAVRAQCVPICTLLCAYKPDLTLVNHAGETVLHVAARGGDAELVEMLVREGASAGARDASGMTALHVAAAAAAADFRVCRALIENGADVNACDAVGRKPVDLARLRHDAQKVRYLESQGGDIIPLYFARHDSSSSSSSSSSSGSGTEQWVPPYARARRSANRRLARLDLSIGNERPVDRWGFEVPESSSSSDGGDEDDKEDKAALGGTLTAAEEKVEERRTRKWEAMTRSREDWEYWTRRSAAKVRERVYKGIPAAARARAWPLLAGAGRVRAMYGADHYRGLLCEASPALHQIDLDINRTFRSHALFRTRYGAGQRMLFNILRAYSVYDRDLAYCQGMAELAAVLLMHMPEEDAFWTLVQLLASPQYALRELFLPGFAALHTRFHVHTRLLQHAVPRLHEHFEAIGLKTVFYATKWYATLFSGVLPFEHCMRVWDIVLLEGTEVLYTIALRTLEARQRVYADLPLDAALPALLSLAATVTEPADAFVAVATHHPVPHALVDTFRLEYARQQFRLNREEAGAPVPAPAVPAGTVLAHCSSEDHFGRSGDRDRDRTSDRSRRRRSAYLAPTPRTTPDAARRATPVASSLGDPCSVENFSFRSFLLHRRQPRESPAPTTPTQLPQPQPQPQPPQQPETPTTAPPLRRKPVSSPSFDSFSSLVSITTVPASRPIPVPGAAPAPASPPAAAPSVFRQIPPGGVPEEALLGTSLPS